VKNVQNYRRARLSATTNAVSGRRWPPQNTRRRKADEALTELQSDLATARLRRDDARRRLKDAEQALAVAEDAYDKGKQASREAAAVVKAAKAQLR
jgi:hypothetical protein